MTTTEYADQAPHDEGPVGKHVLRPEDECTRRDAVTLYGWITDFVMPLPLKHEPPRHWNGRVA
ncbi:hypothetical protein [Saccharopolyspora phatthalungensis]|uniref:Uncharacterized protein n=1 Tax=Saccharopolyspora phatthalungensis TaxID=664693 RepID=A0A840Q4U2_9PSEU|nr:hypothetical protein [Saccharopolyspora phatthalungensis]MBB5154997.1 hypothetical protein [Saccharopolyspora phatthalungensis]